MADDYLQIPLQPGLVIQRKQLKRCSINDSVSAMVRLITTTHFGENKQDDSFGNELWEHDFETVVNVQDFKESMAETLKAAIIQHEKRLDSVKVSIGFDQVLTKIDNRRIRQRIQIIIEGNLRKTNEPFSHSEVFFIGPLSYY